MMLHKTVPKMIVAIVVNNIFTEFKHNKYQSKGKKLETEFAKALKCPQNMHLISKSHSENTN